MVDPAACSFDVISIRNPRASEGMDEFTNEWHSHSLLP
jgi:hypothetical protein